MTYYLDFIPARSNESNDDGLSMEFLTMKTLQLSLQYALLLLLFLFFLFSFSFFILNRKGN